MTLDSFKELHGIVKLTFDKSKRTGRLVARHSLPIVVGAARPVDFKKNLYISECKSSKGDQVFVIHNQEGWESSDVEL